ncbi:MAG TPA: CHASE2 domain-containing protein [Steroidobacteraceae bacterium]
MASKLARFSWLPGGLAATVVLAVGRLVAPDSGLGLETKLYDRIHRSSKVAPSADIVVLSIDKASIEKLGKWPWGWDVHATAIDRLRTAGASVIGWTVPFGSVANSADLQRVRDALSLLESSGLGNNEQARELRQLLRAAAASSSAEGRLVKAMEMHGRVVLPIELRLTREATSNSELPPSLLIGTNNAGRALQAMQLRPPQENFLRAASAVGHVAFAPDADGTVRSDVVAVRSGYDSIPSLATAIATEALGLAPNDIAVNPAALRIGDRSIPLDSQQRMLPQYFSRAAFKELPFWRVWSGEVPSEELRGKVVLIGFPDAEISEATTIMSPVGPHLPDVIAIASATSSILDATYYSRPTSAIAIEWAAMIIVVLAAAWLLPAAGIAIGAVASAVVVAALGITEIGLLSSMRIWPHLALPALAMLGGFSLYVVGELIRRANVRSSAQSKDSTASLRTLGQTFHKQGQLDLAFETYRRCPLDAPTMELLYQLGLDFERRRQNQKAAAVYSHIASRDPNYRDLRMRRARVREDLAEREAPRVTETPAAPQLREAARPQTRPAATPTKPGTRTLGRYEIEREIGKGAMGVVYLGRDPKINRVVAIKAIPLAEEFEDEDLEEARARFFREAEMAGRLNHPAIVTVYDAGEDQGLAYIAMEYLRGQHLSYYTDPARLLPPGTVLTLIARVADALHYAHRQNVVHRDIKPANIMFNSDTDELKITDFGIARLTDTSRTKTGIVLGTPSFMSPEQLEGRSLDGRSDQFALGVSLYQLLCGQLPFRAESMPRLMQKIATEPHPPIRSIRPELPEGIEPILDRVLAKSADDRYPTCAEFAAALRACAQQLAPPKRTQAEHEWLLP